MRHNPGETEELIRSIHKLIQDSMTLMETHRRLAADLEAGFANLLERQHQFMLEHPEFVTPSLIRTLET